MLLVTASENDVGQTEFHIVMYGRCGVVRQFVFKPFFVSQSCTWNSHAVEGDSPVDMLF